MVVEKKYIIVFVARHFHFIPRQAVGFYICRKLAALLFSKSVLTWMRATIDVRYFCIRGSPIQDVKTALRPLLTLESDFDKTKKRKCDS